MFLRGLFLGNIYFSDVVINMYISLSSYYIISSN